ncbi:hypothetical protein SUGI_0388090 [Cryptomeria japonica]|nr:hypothetical protein SUGI_0388090 [Cryptomeria japonica]
MDTLKLSSFFLSFSVSLTLPLIALLACLYFFNGGKPMPKLPPGPRGLPVLGSLLDLGSNPHHSLYAFPIATAASCISNWAPPPPLLLPPGRPQLPFSRHLIPISLTGRRADQRQLIFSCTIEAISPGLLGGLH